MRKQRDYRKGIIECKGRKFLAEFWTDWNFCLPYVRLSEIVQRPVRKRWFSGETELRDTPMQIDMCWTEDDRVEWCEKRIAQYLDAEKRQKEEHRRIEELCGKERCG